MLENSSSNIFPHSETNVFKLLNETNPFQVTSVVVAIISIAFGTPAFYFIIWYERFGSDKKRTLMNKLVSGICWSGIEWNLISQTTFVLRFTYGPLPSWICFCVFILRKAIIIQCFIYLNAIAVTRYILIFWLKNPAALKDEFWYLFVNLWTVLFSFMLPIVRAVVPGNQLLELYICTGMDRHREI
jgi:hypothetical protein